LQIIASNDNQNCFLLDYCSHFAAYRYWALSLLSEKLYPAKQCSSWKDFKSRKCDKNPTNFMGYDAMKLPGGIFFNVIEAVGNLFQDENAKVFNYIGVSFEKRSGILKFLKILGIF
jgi:Lipase